MRVVWAMALAAIAGWAQDNGTRGIVPEAVVQARPAAVRAHKSGARPKYTPIGPAAVAALRERTDASQLGVTIWRLRRAGGNDGGARLLVQDESGTVEWIPERVPASASLKRGDKVRLTLESPERGYLYVIDRERYASGQRGKPYLIFPTTRTRGGDNQMAAGKAIEIPGQEDQPNFFTLRPSRPDAAGEELTVLLTPKPLPGLEIGAKPVELSEAQAGQWERQWGAAKPQLFELADGAGKAWTPEEQAAGTGTRVLTQDDPPPQTIYRVAVPPGAPLMVKVNLRTAGK